MKKLFLVLMMCLCSSLYATTRTYFIVGDRVPISFAKRNSAVKRELNSSDYKDYTVSAVYPYADGYIIELYDESHDIIKYFVSNKPGTIVGFLTWISDETGYKNVIASITECRDNRFNVEYSEY